MTRETRGRFCCLDAGNKGTVLLTHPSYVTREPSPCLRGLSNYASLYAQNSPWAQKASKAAYANAVVGK